MNMRIHAAWQYEMSGCIDFPVCGHVATQLDNLTTMDAYVHLRSATDRDDGSTPNQQIHLRNPLLMYLPFTLSLSRLWICRQKNTERGEM